MEYLLGVRKKLNCCSALKNDVNVSYWPNPAVQASLAGCQVGNPAVASTGRYRPEADSRLLNVKISEVAKRIERSSTLRSVYR
jgi:hypothetical protein